MRIKSLFTSFLLIVVFMMMTGVICLSGNAYAATPSLCFTDIISGPASGLNDGRGAGAIVTIWGNNLGTSQGTSQVYFQDSNGSVRAAAYVYYWCNADGGISGGGPADLRKLGLQEVSFSIPAGSVNGLGKIFVKVAGVNSNTLDFSIRSGRILYCDASVSSSGTGSWSSPWKTNANAYNNMQPGDIVYFKSGTYNAAFGNVNGWDFGTGAGEVQNGTYNAPYAWIGYPGHTPYFPGNPNNSFHVYSDVNGTYFTFSKLKCYANIQAFGGCGYGTNNDVRGWGDGVRIIGNDCDAEHTCCATSSIIDVAGNATIFGNTVHGNNTNYKLEHAIYTSGCPSSGSDIGWNYIYGNADGVGPWIEWNMEAGRCSSGNYVGTRNLFHHNYIDMRGYATRAISIWDMSYTVGDPVEPAVYIYNNIFVGGSGSGGTPVINHADGHIYLLNNTFYNAGETEAGGVIFLSSTYFKPHNTFRSEIRNNIFYANPNLSKYITTSVGQNFVIENNAYYGKGSGPAADPNPVNADPLMVNPASGVFSLQASSPCIGTGTSNVSAVVKTDFFGKLIGSSYSIGSIEYIDAPPPVGGGGGGTVPTPVSPPTGVRVQIK